MEISVGGVKFECLLDTGSNISSVTASFFNQRLKPKLGKGLDDCSWLHLSAAQGLDIPYVGYVETDIEAVALGQTIPGRGIVVVKDPVGEVAQERKQRVPGLIGMNVIKKCYDLMLCGKSGPLPPSVFGTGWEYALAACLNEQAVSFEGESKSYAFAASPTLVPAGSVCLVPASSPSSKLSSWLSMLVEPLGFEEGGLPRGLVVSSAYVEVSRGHLAVPVINVGSTDVRLKANTRLASLQPAEVVAGEDISVCFERVGPQQERVMIREQQVTSGVQEVPPEIAKLCLSGLSDRQAEQARQLLCKYSGFCFF